MDRKKQIVYKKLDEIIPYENNARINDKAIDIVTKSIKEFKFQNPIIIDKNNVIVCGHTRLEASKKLGLNEVPCIMADDLTDEQIKAFRIADNSTAQIADWDLEKLNEELATIDFDMAQFGLEEQLKQIEREFAPEIVEDEVPEVNEGEPICKLGDIWKLGGHSLMCGDSTNENEIKLLVGNNNIDLIYTDHPYGMNAVSKSGVLSEKYKNDIMNDENNIVAINSFLTANKLYKSKKQIWWGANYYTECLPSSECWIVWDKNNGNSDQTDCELAWSNFRSVVRQFTMASEKINRVHPTQKPIKLLNEILIKFDKDKSIHNILDLFGGSGSTLICCEKLDINCYMMELDPKYCDVIIKRWENLTGLKAKKIN